MRTERPGEDPEDAEGDADDPGPFGGSGDSDADPWGDAAYGLTPREWLDSDAVPLTPDIDLDDPEQRIAWIRANNAAMIARGEELARRRRQGTDRGGGGRGGSAGPSGSGPTGGGRTPGGGEARSSTTVVGVRLLVEERRALVRVARREDLTVSDLVRRWVRAGLAAADDAEDDERPDRGFPAQFAGGPDEAGVDAAAARAEERTALRRVVEEAADAVVTRIVDDLRRLREIVAATG